MRTTPILTLFKTEPKFGYKHEVNPCNVRRYELNLDLGLDRHREDVWSAGAVAHINRRLLRTL